jgi:hypothetical protein
MLPIFGNMLPNLSHAQSSETVQTPKGAPPCVRPLFDIVNTFSSLPSAGVLCREKEDSPQRR